MGRKWEFDIQDAGEMPNAIQYPSWFCTFIRTMSSKYLPVRLNVKLMRVDSPWNKNKSMEGIQGLGGAEERDVVKSQTLDKTIQGVVCCFVCLPSEIFQKVPWAVPPLLCLSFPQENWNFVYKMVSTRKPQAMWNAQGRSRGLLPIAHKCKTEPTMRVRSEKHELSHLDGNQSSVSHSWALHSLLPTKWYGWDRQHHLPVQVLSKPILCFHPGCLSGSFPTVFTVIF